MLIRFLFCFAIINLKSGGVNAQTDAELWILGEILKDKPLNSEISWTGSVYSGPLLPEENPENNVHDYNNNLVMTRDGLFLNIDGTGKVFKWMRSEDHPANQFVRQDSTRGFGYNYRAFVFSHRDTIFSLGGYGYWNHNWHLRYYSTASHQWEIAPINKRIHVSQRPYGLWVNQRKGYLYLCSMDSSIDEGLTTYKSIVTESYRPTYVYQMDLTAKTWRTLGIFTPETRKLYDYPIRVGASPFGEILMRDSKEGFPIRFVDISNNRVLELKDKELSTRIYHALLNPKFSDFNYHHVTYVHNSTLTILLGNKTRFDFRIDSTDLKILPFKVYEPLPDKGFDWSPPPWWLAGGQTVLIITLVILVLRRKTTNREGTDAEEPQAFFDSQEIRVIEALTAQPKHTLSTEQIDEILGTANKSVDLKNKRRSLVIRSINQKFQERFETDEPLIRAIRMESDRRMVQYILQTESHQRLQELLR